LEEGEELGIEFTDIEAPYIHYRDGYYYLFANWGSCCNGTDSTYRIVVGRSEEVEGPYFDKRGRDMIDAGGSTVLRPRPNRRIVGPGHAGILRGGLSGNENRDYLSFHFYDK